ncbi:MAG: YitT family protein [Acidobacteriota bacterium]
MGEKFLKLKQVWWPWILITAGSVIAAAGYVIFILPMDMVEGGVTGIGIIVKHLTGLPIVGVSSLVITAIVFIFAIKILGKGFGAKSIYATILMNVLIDFFSIMKISLNLSQSDILLAAFYGGASVGLGLGLIYFAGASTGGADGIAQILWKMRKIPIGRTLIIIDVFVLTAAAVIFIPVKNIMYSMIFIYIEIKVIDMVLNGLRANQRIMIVTDYPDKMKKAIFTKLSRGLTIFKGVGGYTEKERYMLTSVLPKKNIPEIRRLIAGVDEKSFVIIQDIHQVYGEGFEKLPEKMKNANKIAKKK